MDQDLISHKCYRVINKHINPLQCICPVEGEPDDCIMCYNTKPLYQFIQCKHTGCYECLQRWYLNSKTCPMCRREYEEVLSDSE